MHAYVLGTVCRAVSSALILVADVGPSCCCLSLKNWAHVQQGQQLSPASHLFAAIHSSAAFV